MLIADSITVQGLPSGVTYMGWAAPEGGFNYSDPGTYTNLVSNSSFWIKDSGGIDVTSYFTGITYVPGTLTITQRSVTVKIVGAQKTTEYNGDIQEVSGYSWSVSEQDCVGTVVASGKDADKYDMGLKANMFQNSNSKFDVTFEVTDGSLTITPVPLTIGTESFSRPFNGVPQTSTTPTVEGLVSGDSSLVTVTVTGTITDVGSTENTYSIDWGGVNPNNYTLTENKGTLTVTAAPITVSSKALSSNKPYDGRPLLPETTDQPTVSGDFWEECIQATRNDNDVNPDVHTSNIIFDINWGTAKESNYDATREYGTLTIDPAPLYLYHGGGEKQYDGTPLNASEITYEAAKNPATASPGGATQKARITPSTQTAWVNCQSRRFMWKSVLPTTPGTKPSSCMLTPNLNP